MVSWASMSPAPERPLRLVIFDATDTPGARARGALREGAAPRSPGLSPAWRAGALLHRIARAADATLGASSWPEALTWAAAEAGSRGRPIASIQLWGHGGWGWMSLGPTRLDAAALAPDHPFAPLLDRVRARLAGPEALCWLRCCSAFGNHAGQRFAESLAARLGCRVAGHTYIIGVTQSGTRALRPGERASWDPREGVRCNDRGEPLGALWSTRGAPSTVSCFTLDLPERP